MDFNSQQSYHSQTEYGSARVPEGRMNPAYGPPNANGNVNYGAGMGPLSIDCNAIGMVLLMVILWPRHDTQLVICHCIVLSFVIC